MVVDIKTFYRKTSMDSLWNILLLTLLLLNYFTLFVINMDNYSEIPVVDNHQFVVKRSDVTFTGNITDA